MSEWVVLIRGINVGGNNRVQMKPLCALLERAGCKQVRYYIQSGNLLLTHDTADAAQIASLTMDVIEEEFGFLPKVMVFPLEHLQKANQANPFPQAEQDPKSLHMFFSTTPPTQPDFSVLDALKKTTESYALLDGVFYLYAPEGIGRSKLAEKVEHALGVPVTGRNLRTVTKLLEMAS